MRMWTKVIAPNARSHLLSAKMTSCESSRAFSSMRAGSPTARHVSRAMLSGFSMPHSERVTAHSQLVAL